MASQATIDRLCAEFDSPPDSIAATVALLEQHATPAYLARYRRHAVGNLHEERLTAIADRLHVLTGLEQRRATILQLAEERGRRTPELEATLAATFDQDLLDDYYQSMRPRRRGIAMQMEEKGLLPLALAIQHRQFGEASIMVRAPMAPSRPAAVEPPTAPATEPAEEVIADAKAGGDGSDDGSDDGGAGESPEAPAAPAAAPADAAINASTSATDAAQPGAPAATERTADDAAERPLVPDVDLRALAMPYVSPEQGIDSPEAALEGALLILADRISHEPTTRARFRDELRRGVLRAKPVNPDGDAGKYREFFDFAEPIGRIPSGRMLALRRAEREKILELQLTLPDGRHRQLLRELHAADTVPGTALADYYDLVFDRAAQQLQDVSGNDVRRRLKEKADRDQLRTYARNLRSQLMAPALGHKKVLSLRTSGKAIWAVLLAEDGSVAQHKTLPIDNDEQRQGALALLADLVRTETPAAIAVPHGRRQAGSEQVVAELRTALGETPLPMVVPVDEAAATIFATSTAGKKAIPGIEVGLRTAISLGRRLQDPLLELAPMDVRTLGLGQSLDDVHQGALHRELTAVKSACIARIGCDLNTASAELLELLPGLDGERAQAIVKHRKQHGGFANRAALRDVPGIDDATFRNVAGCLRILGGTEPLDATPIHPDDYELVRAIAAQRSAQPVDLLGKNLRDVDAGAFVTAERSREHVIGVLQLLQRGADDERGELVATANEGVHSIADLHPDRQLKGRVAGLTEFGAFVDLGIGQDGLVHISQIPGHRLRDPNQMLRVGEVVTVWILNVDRQHNKISLTMHQPRHLQEGRLPTLGERLEQQQGRRRGRGGPRDGAPRDGAPRVAAAEGRRPGARAGRSGPRRGPGDGDREGGPRFGRGGPRQPGDPRERGPREPRDDRGPRPRGPREQRVYTVEPAREVAEVRTHKGEVTSLSSLRNLLARRPEPETPAPDREQP